MAPKKATALYVMGVLILVLGVISLVNTQDKGTVSANASVNVGQVDGSEVGAAVPCTPSQPYQDIPGLQLTLETKGRPVLVMFNVQAILGGTGIINLRPVIDGQPPDSTFISHAIGSTGETTTLSWSRVYALDRGSHTFGVQFSCQAGVTAAFRWLTVYELR